MLLLCGYHYTILKFQYAFWYHTSTGIRSSMNQTKGYTKKGCYNTTNDLGKPPKSRLGKKSTQKQTSIQEPATQPDKKSVKKASGFFARLYGKMKRSY